MRRNANGSARWNGRQTKCTVGIQAEAKGGGGGDLLARLSIIATSSEESNYRPTNLITASEGATGGLGEGREEGKRARMPVEMGDAATSIVGRLITLSGCLPQATGVIRATFYSRRDLSFPLEPTHPPRSGRNPKTDRADFKECHNATDHQVLSRKVA